MVNLLFFNHVLICFNFILKFGVPFFDVTDEIVISKKFKLALVTFDLLVILELRCKISTQLFGLNDVIVGLFDADVSASIEHFDQFLMELVAEWHV